MPDFMKAEHARFEIKDFCGIYHRAKRVHYSTDDQPDKYPSWERGKQLSAGDDAQPAHEDVDTGIQPARRADVENFHHDSNDRQRPDDGQHAPLPKASEGVHAEWGVGSRDQEKNCRMVNLAEDFKDLIFCAHHVIGGAGGKHGNQADTVNCQRNNFGGCAPTDNEEGNQACKAKDRSRPVCEAINRFA